MDVWLPKHLPLDPAGTGTAVLDAVVRPNGASDLARFSQRLRALNSLSTRLVLMAEETPAYQEMVNGAWRVLGSDTCALYLVDRTAAYLELRGVAGCEPDAAARRLALDDESRSPVQAFCEEYMVHVPDVGEVPDVVALHPSLRSILVFPVQSQSGPIGVFAFGKREPHAFSTVDVDMGGMLVDQMTYMLENFRLVHQLSATRDAVIRGMAVVAESRDKDIGPHLDRMCEYSRLLAQRLQEKPAHRHDLDDAFIEVLARAAALHDVGKVGIPDRILQKPGKLSEEEFAVMRTHANLGERILRDLMTSHGAFPMLVIGCEVAAGHHERWDGRGYPRGLAREDIPLSARIVAVADVYDALTSNRCYKKAWSQDETLTYFRQQAGRQFDPEIAGLLPDCAADLQRIRDRHPD